MAGEGGGGGGDLFGMEALTFNIKDGFLEGVVRGYRSGLLSTSDYSNLSQCETLDDIKLHLGSTDYADVLQNEPSPLHTSTLVARCTEKLVAEFTHLRAHSEEPLSTFLEYCTYGYMIDNVVLIVTGTLHNRDVHELLAKCHPLGLFDSLASLAAATSMRELYRLVLCDTPLAPYFSQRLTHEDLDEMNIEVLRNTLYKAYLEDFRLFCARLGGATATLMEQLLSFEADRRVINITINSSGTELTRDERKNLYPNFGLLFPYGQREMAAADDFDGVRNCVDKYPPLAAVFARLGYGEGQLLDKVFFEEEVKICMLSFEQQFHYAVFFAYLKLREQEIRNMMWISECVAQSQRTRITDGIVAIF